MTLSPLVLGWTLLVTVFHPNDTITRNEVRDLSEQKCFDMAQAEADRVNQMNTIPVMFIVCRPPPGYIHE
jgi:hypothetical protein